MVKLTTFSLLLLLAISSCNRSEDGNATIDYPSGRLTTDSAELFFPGIISSDSFEHSAPTISPDGRTVLWWILEMPLEGEHLEMNYEDGKWSIPVVPHLATRLRVTYTLPFHPMAKLFILVPAENCLLVNSLREATFSGELKKPKLVGAYPSRWI